MRKLAQCLSHLALAERGHFANIRGGMLFGADSKTLLKQLAHSGFCIAVPVRVTLPIPCRSVEIIWSQDKAYSGGRNVLWSDNLPSSLSGAVWHASCACQELLSGFMKVRCQQVCSTWCEGDHAIYDEGSCINSAQTMWEEVRICSVEAKARQSDKPQQQAVVVCGGMKSVTRELRM